MPAITRRDFLAFTAGAVACAPIGRAQKPPQPAPFRVLYSNDLTNLLSCTSPFHQARDPFRKEMLEASIDEVADRGVDVHLLQPGLGCVPLWPSEVLPLEAHVAWLHDRYGIGPDPFLQFALAGGDVVQTFIDRCRQRSQRPFLSIRMNDVHHKEYADTPRGQKVPGSASMAITRFYAEHPEYRIGPGKSSREVALNWAEPAVREQRLVFLGELCARYDFEGLELDILRYYSLFRPEETTREQRCEIMTRFIGEVRTLLDRARPGGNRRWLGLRVPCYLEALDLLGLDLPALVTSGVDFINASAHYFTTQEHALAAIRARVPEATLFFELCHTVWKGEKLLPGYDVFPFRRATPEHLQTAAHLAYARGADGISLFNFAYYRQHGQGEGRGDFGEPPFAVIRCLADRPALAAAPQHWFIAPGWRAPGAPPMQVPRRLAPGKPTRFTFDLAPPAAGWRDVGRLRVQFAAPPAASSLHATFNGTELHSTPDVSEPYPVRYAGLLGHGDELRAWQVPAESLRPGKNEFDLTMDTAPGPAVLFVDLVP